MVLNKDLVSILIAEVSCIKHFGVMVKFMKKGHLLHRIITVLPIVIGLLAAIIERKHLKISDFILIFFIDSLKILYHYHHYKIICI